jgi:hypothetical protein
MQENFNAFKAAYVANRAINNPENESLDKISKTTVQSIKPKKDVSDRPRDSQPDREGRQPEVQEDGGLVQGERAEGGEPGGANEVEGDQGNRKPTSGKGLNGISSPVSGKPSNPSVPDQLGIFGASDGAGIVDGRGNSIDSPKGPDDGGKGNVPVDKPTQERIESFANQVTKKREQQRQAEKIAVKPMDIDNIRETLPFLLAEQQDDVLKAETRFFGEKSQTMESAYGKGIMFTNGTGTGKTYTGLGIVKRFLKQGKTNILLVTPSQNKVADFIEDGKNLGIDITALKDTKDGGKGVVMTTFANFRANEGILSKDWDLIIYDESHRIMESKGGTQSSTTEAHYKNGNKDEFWELERLKDSTGLWKQAIELRNQINDINVRINKDDTMSDIFAQGANEIKELDKKLKARVIKEGFQMLLKDNSTAWLMNEHGHYHQTKKRATSVEYVGQKELVQLLTL